MCQPTAHGKTGDPLRFQKIYRVPNVCRVFCPLAHDKDVNPLRFENFCRVVIVCRVSRSAAHGKRVLCRVPVVCRELHLRHTAKGSFAVCPRFGSRQTIGHTANIQFPVVPAANSIFIDHPRFLQFSRQNMYGLNLGFYSNCLTETQYHFPLTKKLK